MCVDSRLPTLEQLYEIKGLLHLAVNATGRFDLCALTYWLDS